MLRRIAISSFGLRLLLTKSSLGLLLGGLLGSPGALKPCSGLALLYTARPCPRNGLRRRRDLRAKRFGSLHLGQRGLLLSLLLGQLSSLLLFGVGLLFG